MSVEFVGPREGDWPCPESGCTVSLCAHIISAFLFAYMIVILIKCLLNDALNLNI